MNLIALVAIGGASFAAIGVIGAELRSRYWARRAAAVPRVEPDAFAFNPFKVDGGFGIVVARTADSLRVQASYGIEAKVTAAALRDAADMLDRPQGARH
jgi:hypothetical protein